MAIKRMRWKAYYYNKNVTDENQILGTITDNTSYEQLQRQKLQTNIAS